MIKGNFNSHAQNYDKYAQIQRRIASALIEKIPHNFKALRILEIGAGTGFISQELKQRFPKASILVCDPAPEMIKVASEKLGTEFDFQVCELPKTSHKFDIIISSMAIQWVRDWDSWMKDIANLANNKAIILVATPTAGTLEFLPQAFKKAQIEYKGLLYRMAEDLQKSAEQCLSQVNHSTHDFCENFNSSIEFFKKIHRIGANVEEKLSPGQLRKLIKECEKLKTHNILNARYQVTFLQAQNYD
ncbi:methyltransferase domain-containing protein [Lentisphaera profundi]|uniref:Methyltransferase domain-containing protein n=1 Tax=Lentisphaera profundi TaxID=1658616 RepID=A0ABY7VTZ5_9BACT|nr:methyltransferase domain-containing protein [Lentisphaera profundi]WDE97234.1 methyltransferase domain-containing protein [Lentisphaera profundi]